MIIKINLEKAKSIAHEIRRAKRAEEFAPLDIKATIPSESDSAEAARQVIRKKYSDMQAEIDAAQSADQIKQAAKL
jgi:hypothetical protein